MSADVSVRRHRSNRFSASAPLDEDLIPVEPQPSKLDPEDLLGRAPGAPRRTSLSFEVMPPRHDSDRSKIDALLATLESYGPDYLAVTSSQRSDWLTGTSAFIERISQTTRMLPLAHLACTAGTRDELVGWINRLIDAGVRGFLALRGDYPDGQDGPGPGELPHATDLINLIGEVEKSQAARFAAGRLAVGVAAYPSGHYSSSGPDEDIDVLLAKQRLGAGFAITQMFFDPEDYLRFRDRARLAGVTIPLIPALAPMISVQRLRRMGQLSGLEVPERLIRRLEKSDTPEGQLDIGLDATADMAQTLLSNDTESLHLYTFNRADVTGELLTRIGIAPRHPRA
jgi:methylenetetrahydrofolate reductase (NADPH)